MEEYITYENFGTIFQEEHNIYSPMEEKYASLYEQGLI